MLNFTTKVIRIFYVELCYKLWKLCSEIMAKDNYWGIKNFLVIHNQRMDTEFSILSIPFVYAYAFHL